jgi:hypothetical protein
VLTGDVLTRYVLTGYVIWRLIGLVPWRSYRAAGDGGGG